jgi:hypothetical protein
VRGWKNGWPTESSLLSAWLAFVALAAIGYIVGRLAEGIVDESVRSRMLAELAAQEAARTAEARTAEA